LAAGFKQKYGMDALHFGRIVHHIIFLFFIYFLGKKVETFISKQQFPVK